MLGKHSIWEYIILEILEIVLVRGLVLHRFDATIKWHPIDALCIFGSKYINGRSFCLSVNITPKFEQYL